MNVIDAGLLCGMHADQWTNCAPHKDFQSRNRELTASGPQTCPPFPWITMWATGGVSLQEPARSWPSWYFRPGAARQPRRPPISPPGAMSWLPCVAAAVALDRRSAAGRQNLSTVSVDRCVDRRERSRRKTGTKPAGAALPSFWAASSRLRQGVGRPSAERRPGLAPCPHGARQVAH